MLGITSLLGCMPNFIKEQSEVARPAVNDEVAEARAMLRSLPLISVRGAGEGEPQGTDAWRHRAVGNALLTSYLRSREARLYRKRDADTSPDGLPRYCIALSGGGMRALAFGTGVLRGLHERGWYDRVAVLSAVSGGAYASYWIAGNVRRGATEAQLLSGSDSLQLAHLRKHAGELLSPSTSVGFVLSRWAKEAAENPPNSSPWQSLANSAARQAAKSQLKLVETNLGGGQLGYMSALDRMLVGGPYRLTPSLSARALSELVAAGRIPLPVWAATARPAGAPPCVELEPAQEIAERSRPLAYAAFEMGPTRMGSDQLGFLSHMLLPPLNATAVSAAGMSVPYAERCELLHQLVDGSVRVENYPGLVSPTDARKAPPRPFSGESFVLTDGGIADNLAVFPLVRRLCADITVVDAEFDPYLVFEGYGFLKQQLANLDIRLEIPELEAVARKNRIPSLPSDPDAPCDNGICLIRPRPECVRREITAGCISADHLTTALYEGELGPIPFAAPSSDGTSAGHWDYTNRVLRIHYIKLSLDAAHIEQYPQTVRDRYASHAGRREVVSALCVTTRDNHACSFPHEPTANLDYRRGEFEAYWDLGRCIVEHEWPDSAASRRPVTCGDSAW